ncbi:MAG: DUF4091 domain-containing protein [Lentisphaeria bacterium]|nr:DUF4091 domain-containing protein [Lentisphaeria bacterium]
MGRHERGGGFRLLVGAAFAWALGAGALPPVEEVAAFQALIRNGGFEAGDAAPEFWDRHPGVNNGRNRHERDTTVYHGGGSSGKLVYLDEIEGPNKAAVQWMKYRIPVEGGSSLLFAGWVRTEGVRSGRVGMHLYDGDGRHLGFRPVPHPADTDRDWQPFEQIVTLPPETAAVGIALYAEKGGTTWYDDVALLGTPQSEAARGTPVLDGHLAEPLWRDASPIRDFVDHTGQALAREQTRAWIAFDDEALYVAFDCPHAPGARLQVKARQRDGTTWLDDSVEVFLDPDHDHESYLQFCVNAEGVLRDSRGRDPAWNSPARAVSQRRADGWSVEIAIPFEGLDLSLRCGTPWGINLVRNDRVRGETVTWSLGGFHHAGRFGNVRLEPDLGRWLAPALARGLDRIDRSAQTRREEFGRAGLSPDSAAPAFALLERAESGSRDLRPDADGPKSPSWQDLHARTRALEELLRQSRAAAVASLFGDAGGQPFAVCIADALTKVRREGDVTDASLTRHIAWEAAQDESESAQVVVVPGTAGDLEVSVETRALEGPGGRIPLHAYRVGYVETGPPRGYTAEYVGWWPDILLPLEPLRLQAGQRQPVWLRVDVPADARPGTYSGQVAVHGGGRRVEVPVSLRVRGFRLPRPGVLPCAFGLYASAWSRYYHGSTPYERAVSPEAYRRWIDTLSAYRLTAKNIMNEYNATREVEGRVESDLSRLAELLARPEPAELTPYGFSVFRLPCPKDWQTGEPKTDPRVVLDRLAAKVAEYTRLGLPAQAYIYGIDEPAAEGYDFVRSIYEQVRRIAPAFPIMQTVNQRIPEEMTGLVNVWCPLSARLDDGAEFYRQRRLAGDRLWLYVCCSPKPPYANFFIDEPAIDHRILFWQARQAGATGVLYWCVCWWDGLPGPGNNQPAFPEIPVRVAEHLATYRSFGVNGDGLLFWPGPDYTPYPSLRAEVVRDGIEDYEYLALLERCVDAAETLPADRRPGEPLLARARALCLVPLEMSRTFTDFGKDRDLLLARRRAVAESIEALVAALGRQPPPPEPAGP